jgi:hypothetical protein
MLILGQRWSFEIVFINVGSRDPFRSRLSTSTPFARDGPRPASFLSFTTGAIPLNREPSGSLGLGIPIALGKCKGTVWSSLLRRLAL